jgi:hypothetical protein
MRLYLFFSNRFWPWYFHNLILTNVDEATLCTGCICAELTSCSPDAELGCPRTSEDILIPRTFRPFSVSDCYFADIGTRASADDVLESRLSWSLGYL